LLDAALNPKIADLGLALIRRPRTGQPNIEGTPAFMAPEVGFQREVPPELAPRADVYSLGCVAYELLTGQLPFQASNGMRMIVQHGHAVAAPPSSLRSELGPDIDYAILRAMTKDPAERTPSAEAFRRDLVAGRAGTREPIRILLVEDNDDFRELMQSELELEFPDAEIVAVGAGDLALAAFDARTPSVVIMDLQMPGLDGIQLTALIRARETSVHVPILIMTGTGVPADWARLSGLGADRFLVKPVVFEDVVTLVRRSLRERASIPPPPKAVAQLAR
jgi:serine/threonine-protein kinase